MKKRIIRIAALALCAVMVCSLCSCWPFDGSELDLSVPEAITSLADTIRKQAPEVGSTKANFYLDNTKSMFGYVSASGENETVHSSFLVANRRLIDIISQYTNYSLNALREESDTHFLKWKSLSKEEMKNLDQKGFYTFGEYCRFAREQGEYGPLQTLIDNKADIVNYDELNVFVTDLAEQKLNNKELAQRINGIIEDRENHAVALYCINSEFHGMAYVPNPAGSSNQMFKPEEGQFNGTRPFYCLIVGPTIEVNELCRDIDDALTSAGMTKGNDFHNTVVLSRRGPQYSPISNPVRNSWASNAKADLFDQLTLEGEKSRYNVYDEYTDAGLGFNLNYKVDMLEKSDQIFENESQIYPGLYYRYNSDNGVSASAPTASIRFLLPVSGLADGQPIDPDRASFKVQEGSLAVYGAKRATESVKVTDEDGEEATEETELYKWTKIDDYQLIEATDPYMQVPTCTYYPKGSTIPRVTGDPSPELLEDAEFPKSQVDLYKVEETSGVLQVNLEFLDVDAMKEDGYEYITVAFSIDCRYRIEGDQTPQWIRDYHLPDMTPKTSGDIYRKTFGLVDFYELLVGTKRGEDGREKANQERIISDVVVTVDLVNG